MGVWIETRLPRVLLQNPQVTPCMGVWIETLSAKHIAFRILSHPVWVCGLKQETTGLKYDNYRHTLYGCVDWNLVQVLRIFPLCVTPCMGVWIETCSVIPLLRLPLVTPCMGVWIETSQPFRSNWRWKSHPVWVCGLKQAWSAYQLSDRRHTLYGCVDWNWADARAPTMAAVTPCMGVWIETFGQCQKNEGLRGHTLYGCVDWNDSIGWTPCTSESSHPVWVCGLKPPLSLAAQLLARHTLYGCVDWNIWFSWTPKRRDVTPCMGVWIET